jgi:hypothetical protein
MTVHLIKLSVGPETLSDLVEWQAARLKEMKRNGQKPELIHVTRHMPKRAEEVLDGGSIYWVIKGRIVARQKLLELRPVIKNNITYCGLVHDKKMMTVQTRAHRPFQGWRYFDPAGAPKDIAPWSGADELPENLKQELMKLGLL